MEENKKSNGSSPGPGNEEQDTSANDTLRGAASKTSVSGQSMIEENSAENTQGGGITGGSVVGGISQDAEDKANANNGNNKGTNDD